MTRKRTSIVWKMSKEEFQLFINGCSSRVEILEKLGLSGYSGNHTTLNRRIREENINIDHILENCKNKLKNAMVQKAIPLEIILIEHSTYNNRISLKRRLISAKLLEKKCYKCGIGPIWNNEKLSLQLDHKNGINNDNRLENLWLLCPNCHSQTSTYAGRNIKTNKKSKCGCGKKIRNKSMRCVDCENRQKLDKGTKIIWPSNEVLLKMIEISNFVQVGKQLGISDNAIRNRLKRRKLL